MTANPDVLIVGGGAVGVCCALELARVGSRVTLIERGAELAGAASSGNLGMICAGNSAPIASMTSLRLGLRNLINPDGAFYLKPAPTLLPWIARFAAACRPERFARGVEVMRDLTVASLALHEALVEDGLETTFRRCGMLNACETEDGLALMRSKAKEHEEAGMRVEFLADEAVRELDPEISPTVIGATYYPDDAHCDPARFVDAVGNAARAAGAEIRFRVEALRLLHAGARVHGVETTAGRIHADTVVLAAGPWAPKLAEQVGVFVPVTGGKGYHVELPAEPTTLTAPTLFVESRVGVTPMPGRIRIGGTLELSGLDESVSPGRVEAIVKGAVKGVPSLAGRPRKGVWRGLRPCSPDGVPIIGKSAGMAGLVMATGHTQMGLALAPITGRFVREIVREEKPGHSLAALSPDRFQPLF